MNKQTASLKISIYQLTTVKYLVGVITTVGGLGECTIVQLVGMVCTVSLMLRYFLSYTPTKAICSKECHFCVMELIGCVLCVCSH